MEKNLKYGISKAAVEMSTNVQKICPIWEVNYT